MRHFTHGLGLALIAAGLIATAASAQAVDGIPFYTEQYASGAFGGEVVTLSPDGSAATVPVPVAFYPAGYAADPAARSVRLNDVALSPDGRYLAGIFGDAMTGVNEPFVRLADLTAPAASCCRQINPPISSVMALELGEFDPLSNQLAFSYVAQSADPALYAVGGIATADPAAGFVTRIIDMATIAAALGEPQPALWALLGGWQDGQVQFAENCFACEGRFEGEWRLWNPATNGITPSTGVWFSPFFGDRLASTNEMLYLLQNPLLPASAEPSMLPIPNAVGYIASGEVPAYDAVTGVPVVFHQPGLDTLSGRVRWVQDGEAFVVAPDASDTWFVVARDGAVTPLAGLIGARLLAGTADGFVASLPLGDGSFALQQFEHTGSGWSMLTPGVTGRFDGDGFYPLIVPPLTGAGFPPPTIIPVAFPASVTAAPSGVICDGFSPRLAAGTNALVTPGEPNRLRDVPSISGRILAQIPGGTIVNVLAGPYCAESYAWWMVTYGDLVGFTVEGTGSTYFMAPAG